MFHEWDIEMQLKLTALTLSNAGSGMKEEISRDNEKQVGVAGIYDRRGK